MTTRVQWTRRGYFAPEFHDFTYAIAAEHFADILREIGRHNVTTHQLDQEAPVSDYAADDATVCIAHGRFIPCRTNGEHRYTANPYWVKSVRDYQGSPIEDLTWEPAWTDDRLDTTEQRENR